MIVRIARLWFGTLLLAPVTFAMIWGITHPDGISVLKELSGVIGAWVMAVIMFYFRKEE